MDVRYKGYLYSFTFFNALAWL